MPNFVFSDNQEFYQLWKDIADQLNAPAFTGPFPNPVMEDDLYIWEQMQRTKLGLAASIPPASSNLFPNETFPSIKTINNITVGNIDLYTVPAGRKAFLKGLKVLNCDIANNNAVIAEIKVAGLYYKYSSLLTLTPNTYPIGSTGMSGVLGNSSMLFLSGETIAINANTGLGLGISVWLDIIEFDDTSSVNIAKLLNPVNGNQILYTCPVGKNALILNSSTISTALQGINASGLFRYFNNSGGNRIIFANIVPFGGVVDKNTAFITTALVANVNSQAILFCSNLSAGDYINFYTDGGGNVNPLNEIAFVIISEQ